jgi:excisionase family DNA binding protein
MNHTSFDEIKSYVDQSIKKETEQLQGKMIMVLDQKIRDRTGDILSADETASLLGVSNRTLSNWAAKGVLPRYKLGGKVYWRFFDVIDYMARDCADEPELKFE